ncbi:LysE family transporter [uncultured Bacteroides sp.]|jgi:threonine/homoserine/homoserine lactone efflux protein|uniref:LysE family translocator n=1 Tax=uncultured Bacteroides sp. TaxID=162156 RepID=UPI00280B2A99|nr:LysE family transporter [uncultured Bacteroides sp.]
MNWIEQVTVLDLLCKGVIVGIVVSAPLGPVGVLCIQRTLNKGRWFGFVTGLGAALSDICYALITGYGMSFMDELIVKHQLFLQFVGSIMLLAFGIYTFRSNPVKSLRPTSSNRGTYLHNFVTAFFVTFSNPLIIFLFIGLFARFSFVMPGSPLGFQLVGYLAIILGALVWWFSITYFVNKVRTRFNVRGIWILNRIIGVVVMIAAIVGLVFAATGKSLA